MVMSSSRRFRRRHVVRPEPAEPDPNQPAWAHMMQLHAAYLRGTDPAKYRRYRLMMRMMVALSVAGGLAALVYAIATGG